MEVNKLITNRAVCANWGVSVGGGVRMPSRRPMRGADDRHAPNPKCLKQVFTPMKVLKCVRPIISHRPRLTETSHSLIVSFLKPFIYFI